MGIKIQNGDVVAIYTRQLPVIAVYLRGQKLWPKDITPIINKILSCYYNGYWIDEYPWTDDTPWTD